MANANDRYRYDELLDVRKTYFSPEALRNANGAVVNKLLASRFDLQIHVNQRCQEPCGRHEPGANPLF